MPTQGPGTAEEVARRSIEEGAEVILAAGVAHSSVPLGILPAGTANVLANEIGLSSNLERAAACVGEWLPTRISMGRLTCANGKQRTRLFLLMAGIGLDAKIVYNISAPLKARVGKIAYYIAGFSLLGRNLEEFDVEIEGRRVTCSFALISKVRNYGGDLQIAQNTSLLDDRFEVVLFEGRSTFRYLIYLERVALRKLDGVKGVSVIRASSLAVSGVTDGRVYVQVDGEFTGHLPARIETVPDALTLLLPPEYVRRSQAARPVLR